MKHIKVMGVILLLLLAVILAVQNYQALSTPVQFKADLVFLKYASSRVPLSLFAVVTFLVGVLATGFYGMAERFRLKKDLKACQNRVREMESELNSLRNLPVTTEDMGPGEASESRNEGSP